MTSEHRPMCRGWAPDSPGPIEPLGTSIWVTSTCCSINRSIPVPPPQPAHWARRAWQWCRSAAPAPGRSPGSPGSRRSAAAERSPRAGGGVRGSWVSLSDRDTDFNTSVSFLSSPCTLLSTSYNSSQSLTLHFCSISPVHFLKQCCCSGRKDRETWSLLFHNM